MKQILTIILALVCAALLVALFLTKRSDNAQHETDASTITELSNTLATAQSQVTTCNGTIVTLSNRLDECQVASVTFSNNFVAAQSTIALGAEQITNLTGQVNQLKSDNQACGQQVLDLTNQIVALNQKVAVTEANLEAVHKDHLLLEDRLRRDVAERLVIQRKFYNPEALHAQLDKLKEVGGSFDVTADKIYAGLDVEVRSNGTIHVLSPE
jgi:chromosome segregation ATPase